jgi:hypothetical protein
MQSDRKVNACYVPVSPKQKAVLLQFLHHFKHIRVLYHFMINMTIRSRNAVCSYSCVLFFIMSHVHTMWIYCLFGCLSGVFSPFVLRVSHSSQCQPFCRQLSPIEQRRIYPHCIDLRFYNVECMTIRTVGQSFKEVKHSIVSSGG